MSIPEFVPALNRILLEAGRPRLILSALSGGMDSVTLLHLLARWREAAPPGCRFLAAHLNHNLRGADADADAEFCRGLAEDWSFPFASDSVDAAAFARDNNLGLEAAGRMLRYRFFRRLADDGGEGGAVVLTGHHADDQAETILMHIRRGAHRRGLCGMREFARIPIPPGIEVPVGRPLLSIERERLRRYAGENRLEWREDASNLDSSLTRNRIRQRIIPLLENVLPGFRRRLVLKAAAIAEEEREMVEEARRLVGEMVRREDNGRIFLLAPEAMRWPERLNYALRQVTEEEMGGLLPYGAALAALTRLAESGRPGEALSLPGGLRVRREADGLFFFFPGRDADESPAEYILPDAPFSVVVNGMEVTADWTPAHAGPPPEDRRDPGVEWLDPGAIRWPLRLRPPIPGERFRPLGAPGSRKIRDILADLKTPLRKRCLPRVLADHAGALWLWPLRLANRARITPGVEKALRVTIRETGREPPARET